MLLREHSFPGKLFFKTLLQQRGNHINAVEAADKFTALRIINVPADDSRCVQCPGYGKMMKQQQRREEGYRGKPRDMLDLRRFIQEKSQSTLAASM